MAQTQIGLEAGETKNRTLTLHHKAKQKWQMRDDKKNPSKQRPGME